MQKKTLINYWDNFYIKKNKIKESSFARFVLSKVKKGKIKKSLIDIGCGNGRDSIFFSKNNFCVTGIDISKKAIKKNLFFKNKNLTFIKFDVEKNKTSKKFDIIYCRFFLHTINEHGETKLLQLIKRIKKKNSMVCFEFRNFKDQIFKKYKKRKHNQVVEFEKGHYRRMINPIMFLEKCVKIINCKMIYFKSSKNLSVVKYDNPNLSRVIFINK